MEGRCANNSQSTWNDVFLRLDVYRRLTFWMYLVNCRCKNVLVLEMWVAGAASGSAASVPNLERKLAVPLDRKHHGR